MTLIQKICIPFGGLRNETINNIEKIADDYATDFGEWLLSNKNFFKKELTTKELLEIFKKEKGL